MEGQLRALGLPGHEQAYTLAALFDDIIDAEQSLAQLRRSRQPAEPFSVILRDRVLSDQRQVPYRAVLSDVIETSSLEAASRWLLGMASLVLPDRASYLAAGPIGQILSTLRDTRDTDNDQEETIVVRQSPTHQLSHTLESFGFDSDEASYIEQRVVIGAPLIAATSTDIEVLRSAHNVFQVNTPVYVGLTRTDSSILTRAAHLIQHGPRNIGSVVIADAMSPLVHVSLTSELQRTFRDLRGRQARSRYGEVIGNIVDLLYEPNSGIAHDVFDHGRLSDANLLLRYVVVQTGRGIGRGRKLVAFPSERVSIIGNDIVIRTTHEELVAAPRYDNDGHLSRQEEAATRRHFSAPFYWINNAD